MKPVYLNIGGRRFETSWTTLNRAPFFADKVWEGGTPEKPIFIDTNPDEFEKILDYLRMPDKPCLASPVDMKFYGLNKTWIMEYHKMKAQYSSSSFGVRCACWVLIFIVLFYLIAGIYVYLLGPPPA